MHEPEEQSRHAANMGEAVVRDPVSSSSRLTICRTRMTYPDGTTIAFGRNNESCSSTCTSSRIQLHLDSLNIRSLELTVAHVPHY